MKSTHLQNVFCPNFLFSKCKHSQNSLGLTLTHVCYILLLESLNDSWVQPKSSIYLLSPGKIKANRDVQTFWTPQKNFQELFFFSLVKLKQRGGTKETRLLYVQTSNKPKKWCFHPAWQPINTFTSSSSIWVGMKHRCQVGGVSSELCLWQDRGLMDLEGKSFWLNSDTAVEIFSSWWENYTQGWTLATFSGKSCTEVSVGDCRVAKSLSLAVSKYFFSLLPLREKNIKNEVSKLCQDSTPWKNSGFSLLTSKGPSAVEWVSFGGGSRKLFRQEAVFKRAKEEGEQDLRASAEVFPPTAVCRLFHQTIEGHSLLSWEASSVLWLCALLPCKPHSYWEQGQGLVCSFGQQMMKLRATQSPLLLGKSDFASCSSW